MLKKTFVVLFGLLFLLLNVALVPVNSETTPGTQVQPLAGEDFTHNVVMELFVTTWCQYCPDAEEASVDYSREYGEHFLFISMVCDAAEGGNEKADERKADYNVETYPSAIFDGGYRDERSGDTDYEDEIESSGTRDVVANVDLSVDLSDNEDGTMDVSYTTTYTDNNPMVPVFQSHIRVYIVERISRYPNDRGEQIPFGFIDFAFDEDLDMASQNEMSNTMTWRYDDYEDATFDNFIVIGAVFDKSSGSERYSVQSATTESANFEFGEPELTPEYPENTDDVTFEIEVIGNVAEVEIEYAICTETACGATEYATMELKEESIYTVTLGDFGSDAVDIRFSFIARDSGGNEARTKAYEVYFGEEGEGEDGSGLVSLNKTQTVTMGAFGALIGVPILMAIWDNKKKQEEEDEDFEEDIGEFEQDEMPYSEEE